MMNSLSTLPRAEELLLFHVGSSVVPGVRSRAFPQ